MWGDIATLDIATDEDINSDKNESNGYTHVLSRNMFTKLLERFFSVIRYIIMPGAEV